MTPYDTTQCNTRVLAGPSAGATSSICHRINVSVGTCWRCCSASSLVGLPVSLLTRLVQYNVERHFAHLRGNSSRSSSSSKHSTVREDQQPFANKAAKNAPRCLWECRFTANPAQAGEKSAACTELTMDNSSSSSSKPTPALEGSAGQPAKHVRPFDVVSCRWRAHRCRKATPLSAAACRLLSPSTPHLLHFILLLPPDTVAPLPATAPPVPEALVDAAAAAACFARAFLMSSRSSLEYLTVARVARTAHVIAPHSIIHVQQNGAPASLQT